MVGAAISVASTQSRTLVDIAQALEHSVAAGAIHANTSPRVIIYKARLGKLEKIDKIFKQYIIII
jgi:hypothetical protein